jgi:hypothetical protein
VGERERERERETEIQYFHVVGGFLCGRSLTRKKRFSKGVSKQKKKKILKSNLPVNP